MGEASEGSKPYDAAMRRLTEAVPASMCRLLGIGHAGPPAVLPASFASTTLTADLLLRLGPGRLAHVEYQHTTEPDLARRMLHYRALIMRDHPGARLSQHVVVLRGGRVTGHDDLARNGFELDLGVVYLRDLDPELLLSDVWVSPLAVLARGDRRGRMDVLGRALGLIADKAGAAAGEWFAMATTFAELRLDEPTIEHVVEEARMTWSIGEQILSRTSFGDDLRAEGRRELLLELLEDRFGPGPEADLVAHQLAAWPNAPAAVRAVNAATTLAELLDLPRV